MYLLLLYALLLAVEALQEHGPDHDHHRVTGADFRFETGEVFGPV